MILHQLGIYQRANEIFVKNSDRSINNELQSFIWKIKTNRNGVSRLIKRINNITFAVSDLKETISFYENVLGLKKTAEWSNYVIFDVGGMELAFEPSGKKGRKEGMPDIFMLVDDVDDVYKKLKEKGVNFVTEPKDQHWGGRTAAFLDPDENMFILVHFKK